MLSLCLRLTASNVDLTLFVVLAGVIRNDLTVLTFVHERGNEATSGTLLRHLRVICTQQTRSTCPRRQGANMRLPWPLQYGPPKSGGPLALAGAVLPALAAVLAPSALARRARSVAGVVAGVVASGRVVVARGVWAVAVPAVAICRASVGALPLPASGGALLQEAMIQDASQGMAQGLQSPLPHSLPNDESEWPLLRRAT